MADSTPAPATATPPAPTPHAAPPPATQPSTIMAVVKPGPNAAGLKVAAALKARQSAAEAVKAVREAAAGAALARTGAAPIHNENPTTAPAIAPAVAAPASVAAASTVTAVTPAVAVQPPEVSSSKELPAPAPQDRSWQSLHTAEQKFLAEKKTYEADKAEIAQLRAKAASAEKLEAELREKGPEVLSRYNWSPEAQARAIIAASNGSSNPGLAAGGSPISQPQTATAPPRQPASASSTPTDFQPDTSEVAGLREQVGQLQSVILEGRVAAVLAKPEFEFLRGEAGANNQVLKVMNDHYTLTGSVLTFEDAAAKVQGELVERVKTRYADPRYAKVLGLNGSTQAAPAPTPAAKAVADSEDEPTTLTSALTGSAQPTFGRMMNERSRHQRVKEAVARARQSQLPR